MFSVETQVLIVELLNQEARRANRPATRAYHKEIEDAKRDFIEHCSNLGPQQKKSLKL